MNLCSPLEKMEGKWRLGLSVMIIMVEKFHSEGELCSLCDNASPFLFFEPLPNDEGLTPTKDEGKCLRRLSMFRKEVH